MRLTLADMKTSDLLQMELRERDMDMVSSMDDWLGNLWEALKKGYGFTILHEDEVVACIGVTNISKGVAEIWAITGKLVDKFPKDFHKVSKRIIEHAFEIDDLHRLQCTAEADFSQTLKWLDNLGFKREGLLRNYTPDKKDMVIYSMLKGEK